jgi:hypothetical protein
VNGLIPSWLSDDWTAMELDRFDLQIQRIERDYLAICKRMRIVCDALLELVLNTVSDWYECTIRAVVSESYEHVEQIGNEAIVNLKSQYLKLREITASKLKRELLECGFWSHEKPLIGIVNDTHPEKEARSENRVVLLVTRISSFSDQLFALLHEFGFQTDRFKYEFQVSPRIRASLAAYSDLEIEAVKLKVAAHDVEAARGRAIAQEQERQERQKKEDAKRCAVERWDNAFNTGHAIDWKQAWDGVGCQSRFSEIDWGDEYVRWLETNYRKDGDNSFYTFLSQRPDIEKFHRHAKRVWKYYLSQNVMSQLGISEWQPWLEQLIEEQVANRNLELAYESFNSDLVHYEQWSCPKCSKCRDVFICGYCEQCNNCCTCYDYLSPSDADDDEEDEEINE